MAERTLLKFQAYDPAAVPTASDALAWLVGLGCLKRYPCGDQVASVRLRDTIKKWLDRLGELIPKSNDRQLRSAGAACPFEPEEMAIVKDALADARKAKADFCVGSNVDGVIRLDEIIAEGEERAKRRGDREPARTAKSRRR